MEMLAKPRSKVAHKRTVERTLPEGPEFSLDPLKASIARMSDADFSRLDRGDLILLVSYSVLENLSFDCQARLDFVDDLQLKRLAYLARLACQRKVNAAFSDHGRSGPFFHYA